MSRLTLKIGQRHKVQVGSNVIAVNSQEDGTMEMYIRVAKGQVVQVGDAMIQATTTRGAPRNETFSDKLRSRIELTFEAPREVEIFRMKSEDGTPAMAPRGVA